MWYGAGGSGGATFWSIGFATSADGIIWSKEAGNPVLSGSPGSWEDDLSTPSVLFDEDDGRYRMWYDGDRTPPLQYLGFALSEPGSEVRWASLPDPLPGFPGNPDVHEPLVLREGPPLILSGQERVFKMWHVVWKDFIGKGIPSYFAYAESADGLTWRHWRDGQPIFEPRPMTWEWPYLSAPMVRYDAAKKLYEMWYGAGTLTNRGDFIGYATSPDGVNWTRLPQPVLGPGSPGGWDGFWVEIPRVHLDPGTNLYRMWFHGPKGQFIDQGLGYATAPRDDAPSRRVVPPPADCTAERRVAVRLERRPRDGEDPDGALTVMETVCGSFTKEAVTAPGASRVEDLPRVPLATVSGLFEGYVPGPCSGCAKGNGSARFDPGDQSYVLESIGEDVGPGGDGFTFAFTRVRGDFTLTARIRERDLRLADPAAPAGSFGLMARGDLTRRSPFVFVHDRRAKAGEDADSTRWSTRLPPNDNFVEEASLAPGDHYFRLRLERKGSRFAGSFEDPACGDPPICELGSVEWPGAPEDLLVGLAATSQVAACCKGPATVTFEEVTLEAGEGAAGLPVEPPPAGVEITWESSPRALDGGLRYEVALPAGHLSFTGTANGEVLVGDEAVTVPPLGCGEAPRFRRGDVDGDGAASITDPVVLLSHLFLGAPAPACPDAADADDSGELDISDPIYNLSWQFLGGPEPVPPGPRTCGEDPTGDALGDCSTGGAGC
jgi:hypothetical protein